MATEAQTDDRVGKIEDYFDFVADDDIRLKGTRIGIEHVLYQSIHRARTPKQIARRYRTITLAQIYATLLYYETYREALDPYLADHVGFALTQRHSTDRPDRGG